MELWSGNTLVGFESFLDLSLLDSTYPTHANVSLGNQFILDMQDGSGNFTNALGALQCSSAAATTSAAVAPLPTSLSLGLTALASIAALSILRQKKTA